MQCVSATLSTKLYIPFIVGNRKHVNAMKCSKLVFLFYVMSQNLTLTVKKFSLNFVLVKLNRH